MEATGKMVQMKVRGEGLSRLKRRFDQWRAGRKVGARIPQELWAGAVDLVGEHGACRVAAELRLDYAVLKRRAGLAGGKVQVQEAPQFVELFGPAGSTTPAGALRPECVSNWTTRAVRRCAWNSAGWAWLAWPACAARSGPRDDPDHAPHAHSGGGRADRLPRWHRHPGGRVHEAPASRPVQWRPVRLRQPRARTAIKVLVYDGQGFWMCHKRLSSGRFTWWPDGAQPGRALQACELQVLLMAGDPSQARAAPAWRALSLAA